MMKINYHGDKLKGFELQISYRNRLENSTEESEYRVELETDGNSSKLQPLKH